MRTSEITGDHDHLKDMQGRFSGLVPYFDRMKIGSLNYMLSGQYFDTDGRFENDDSQVAKRDTRENNLRCHSGGVFLSMSKMVLLKKMPPA